MSKGGGSFGFLEVCGNVIPSSLQSQLDSGEIIPHPPTIPLTTITAGTVEVVMRTSETVRFPGFSASVVCVNTSLLMPNSTANGGNLPGAENARLQQFVSI